MKRLECRGGCTFPSSRPPHGGRGLKRVLGLFLCAAVGESPPARGARIETSLLMLTSQRYGVAPRTGGAD